MSKKNPVLRQRKTTTVGGMLTRNYGGGVFLWKPIVDRSELWQLEYEEYGPRRDWYIGSLADRGRSYIRREWTDDEFKAQYTGIPRKGRAVWVEIEIVV